MRAGQVLPDAEADHGEEEDGAHCYELCSRVEAGLVPAVVMDAAGVEILMVVHPDVVFEALPLANNGIL